MVRRFHQAVAFAAAAATGVLGASENMGPASFMWPPDRTWSEHTDNEGPCGSAHGVTSRTKFPLTGGKVALIAQDDSYRAVLSISFHNDPQEQKDFGFVLNTTPITEIDPGHTCFSIPDPPSTIAPGTNATIQLMYVADFDRPENQTFYACADIQYVRAADFPADSIRSMCFNETVDDDVPAPTATGRPTNLPGHGDNIPPVNTAGPQPSSSSLPSNNDNAPNESANTGLSKGAIAGAVVGSVAGVALILALAFLFYRERQRKNRLIAQRDSGRGVPWVEDPPKNSTISADSVILGTRS